MVAMTLHFVSLIAVMNCSWVGAYHRLMALRWSDEELQRQFDAEKAYLSTFTLPAFIWYQAQMYLPTVLVLIYFSFIVYLWYEFMWSLSHNETDVRATDTVTARNGKNCLICL